MYWGVALAKVPLAMARTSIRPLPWPLLGALLVVPLAAGCPAKKDKPAEAKKTAPVKKAEKKPEPAPKKAAQTADPDCIAPWKADGEASKVEVGARAFARTGTKLAETSTDEDSKAVLGVIANVKEDTPDNLKNIAAALAFFKDKGADAIVVVGDLGETQSQIENGLKPIAASGLPVFTVIGNREKKSDYKAAVASVGGTHSNVFDLNQIRLAAMDDVALVSVPGYYDKAYIHAEEGCQYFAGDLEGTKPALAAAGGKPTIVVSHGPPKQEGNEALDRTLEQANVGDPGLAKFLADNGVKFGFFSNIQEAGGRATDLSGKTLIKPSTPSDSLFVNPGAIDSVSWEMNDGSRSVGMATVVTIDGGKASFEVFKVPEKS